MYKIGLNEVPENWGSSKIFMKNIDQKIESGLFQCDPGASLPLHSHAGGDEYCYLISGTGIFVIDNKEEEVIAGELIKIPKGVVHRSYNTGQEPFISFYLVCP